MRGLEYELECALKSTRTDDGLSLRQIAQCILDTFDKAEVEALIKEINYLK